MNKDQIKGVAKQIGGEIQQEAGKLTGDTSTRIKGHAKEAEGKLQKGLGDAKEAVADKADELEARKTERDAGLKR